MKLSKKVKPLHSDILVSMKSELMESKAGIIIPESAKSSMLSVIQEVMAVGPNCSQVKVGDEICIKMGELFKPVNREVRQTSQDHDIREIQEWVLDMNRVFIIDDKEYLLIREGNIAYRLLRDEETIEEEAAE